MIEPTISIPCLTIDPYRQWWSSFVLGSYHVAWAYRIACGAGTVDDMANASMQMWSDIAEKKK